MTRFEDHFSALAGDYVRYRPQYPAELFAWLASVAPGRRMAWDCGTGNGQAAVGLAPHFDRVVATDASVDQLRLALPHERIVYRVERAEDPSMARGSVDLVTVAVAVHWFDFDTFYAAVRRVSAPGGVLAVWAYLESMSTPALDRVLHDYTHHVLGGYWPERWRFLGEAYRTLPFPFEEITPPPFAVESHWNLDQLVGFLTSWSATPRYIEARGEHPVKAVWPELIAAWGDPAEPRLIRWPLNLRVGRVR